ncbi:monosaccharide ABC transporter substrate-binding protein (CUT2 family) [Mobilisporobacter senegalensis]|uniref:Monosaccharide ABC transporter substrate-binding protein (CUT2 family) n=1 Tax=Mobilisporobacter senegalensis TaxID=1329262 RepID=A0A3N1XVM4_9FIRM|nr:sugar-binding protein [Mobilisporobacter senegalensis]ROR30669.1 monosaccharide ABC transporter substrate-binding protein (CUT2 family) [Mobilisporobacter senegalensis]
MKMKKQLSLLLATALVATVAMTGCGGRGTSETKETEAVTTTEETTTEETTTAEPEKGFAADATIGVSLPWLGTQNWKEADEMFKTQLEAAGFKAIVQAADNKVPQQQQQIESMIQNGVKVIVVGPVDGTQLGSVLEEAAAAGIAVIGYDRLLENTTGVDGVVQFGSVKTGELQGQALLDGLAKVKGEGPYNIELFGGGPADPNAPNFFKGAMSVLQPKIDDGTLVVVSGQTDFTQCATPDWDNSKAQARMDSLLSGFYSDKEIHGVLSPNDGIARAIITASEQAGQEIPVVSGLDAENESVQWVWSGRQYSTVAKPTDALVSKTIEIIKSLQAGNGMPAPDTNVNNGKKDVGVFELPPVVVTKENAKEIFANDPGRLDLLK